jgi:hypothetical protein
MTVPPTDLNFLKEDLRRQREIAEEALREAKKKRFGTWGNPRPEGKRTARERQRDIH